MSIGTDNFEIKLPLFKGPFDLLLFFIERDELDIHDIPIAEITKDFLDYLHHLEHMNIEVASEFILVAAKLMRIKAKMLLPRPQLDEEGNEIDPREELVKHLLEYKRFKEVLAQISDLEQSRQQMGVPLNERHRRECLYCARTAGLMSHCLFLAFVRVRSLVCNQRQRLCR